MMLERRLPTGFTLLEVTVALTIGGMALAGAVALLGGMGNRAEAITRAAAHVDRDANAERLLRTLVANVDPSADSSRTLAGDARSVTFHAWCETPAAWLDRCTVRVFFEHSQGVTSLKLAVAPPAGASEIVLRNGLQTGSLRYLVDPKQGGTWASSWQHIVVPAAVAVIMDRDTLLLAVWGGG